MSRDGAGLIGRYLQILEAVAASDDGLTLTRITALTGLPKPTAHRLVKALVDAGALSSEGDWYRTFRIGERMWRMLYLGQNGDSVRAYAQIVLDELAGALKETCYLVRLGHAETRSIARSVPDQGHRLHVLPGDVLPLHAAASAKAILAFQDAAVVDRLLSGPLEPLTSRTLTVADAVRAELSAVRREGFAICDREIDENVMAYAVPVRPAHGGILYAIGVTGPVSRMGPAPRERWTVPLEAAASRLARGLETLEEARAAV